MLEQELASIMKYLLDTADNPSPYYWQVPQNFVVPAIYFPIPEIVSGGETFLTYKLDYAWYIKIFHRSSQLAHALGQRLLTAIMSRRRLVSLISPNGEHTAGAGALCLHDPKLKPIEEGVVQLALSWRSRRPYNSEVAIKMQHFEVDGWAKAEVYKEKLIEQAYADVVEHYAKTREVDL